MDRQQRYGVFDLRRRRQQISCRRPSAIQDTNLDHHGRDDPCGIRRRKMEEGAMRTTSKHRKNVPTTFDALICELMPSAIHDKVAYGNALEMVRRLATVPALNEDQTRYLDTLCVLVA